MLQILLCGKAFLTGAAAWFLPVSGDTYSYVGYFVTACLIVLSKSSGVLVVGRTSIKFCRLIARPILGITKFNHVNLSTHFDHHDHEISFSSYLLIM